MPLGILNSDCLLTQTKDGATITVDELLSMENKVKNRSKAAWYGNRSVLPGLRKLKIDTNFYAFTGQGLHGMPTDQLLGKEFVELEQLPYYTAANALVLANMEDYMIFKKAGGMNSAQSIHVDFLKEVNTFRFSMRVTGRPMYDEAITLYDGTSKVSPFVSVQAES
jgi:HK97 family phage major capsid protein